MAHIMSKRGNLDNIVTFEHFCDTNADLQDISLDYRTLGSIAIVLQGNSGGLQIYITNSQRQWLPLSVSSSGGGSGEGGNGLTAEEVNALISSALSELTTFSVQIVDELPESDIDTNTIYLVSNGDNSYDQYMYINNNWSALGDTNIHVLQNIRDGHGLGSIEQGYIVKTFSSLEENSATGNYSHAQGLATTASNSQAHAQGTRTIASGEASHAEGYITLASYSNSHAQGANTQAIATQAHAEGMLKVLVHKLLE